MRKRIVSSLFAMALLVSVLSANCTTALAVQSDQIHLMYTGIFSLTTTLNISASGAASCYGSVIARNGYTVNLTVELKRDGSTIKTWTDSGSGAVVASGTYFVTPGHTYVVTTSAEIYKGDTLIESPSKDSPESSY